MGLPGSYVLSTILLLSATCPAENSIFEYAQDTWASEYGEIIFSAMVFRHGDRYGFGDFPYNPHTHLFKDRRGLLTEAGKLRAHSLGRWTRMRYHHLYGAETPYNAELLHMISSPSVRVLESARLFLTGFYQPNSEDQNVKGPWEPTPAPENDRMMTMREHCPRFNIEIEIIKKLSPTFTETMRPNKTLLNDIKMHTGLIIPEDDLIVSVKKVSLLYDTLKAMKELNLELPAWWSELYQRVYPFAIVFYKLHTFNHVMKRLKAGPLLGHIVNELKAKRDQPESNKRFQFYAGHDSNIVALLDVLSVWDDELPKYGSAIFFELRKFHNDLFVTVSYRNSIANAPPILLNVPDCPNRCPLDTFIQYTTDYLIPQDWDKECQTPDYNTILF